MFQELGNLRSDSLLVPQQHVTSALHRDQPGAGDMLCHCPRVVIERQWIVYSVDDQYRHGDFLQRISSVDVRVGDVHIEECPIGTRVDGQDGFHRLCYVRFVLGSELEALRHAHD